MDNGSLAPETNKAPSTKSRLISSLIAAAGIVLMPFLPVIGALALSAATVFLSATEIKFYTLLADAAALVALFFIGGPWFAAVGAAFVLASVITGRTVASGGNFINAVMTYTLTMSAAAFICVAVYVKTNGIVIPDAVASFTENLKDSFRSAFAEIGSTYTAALGNTEALEEARAEMLETYLRFAELFVMFIPAVAVCLFEVIAGTAMRVASVFFNLTESDVYSGTKREARLNRIYAALYALSFILSLALPDGAGLAANNVMIVLMLPAAYAGACGIIRTARRLRSDGMRGPGIFLPVMLAVMFVTSPPIGLTVCSVAAALVTVRPRRTQNNDN